MNLNFDEILAQDLSKTAFKNVQIYDVDAIESNIDNLIMTTPGERLFNLQRGTSLYYKIFELGDDELDSVLDDLALKIKRYVPQIVVIEQNMRLVISNDGDTANITIPYIIRVSNTSKIYQKTLSK